MVYLQLFLLNYDHLSCEIIDSVEACEVDKAAPF